GTVRRQRPRGAHRSVTCRATMPPRARRSSAVSGSVEASASSKRLRNASTSASTPAAPYPLGRSHTGMVRPSARKEPTYLVPSPMADSRRACNRESAIGEGTKYVGGFAAGVQPRDRVDHLLLVSVEHPAQMLLGAGVDPVAVRQALHRAGGH